MNSFCLLTIHVILIQSGGSWGQLSYLKVREGYTPWLPAYRMITQRDGQPFILTISPTANLDSPVTRCMSSDCWSKRTQTGKKQSKTFFFFFNNNFTNSWFTSFPRISWRAYNSLLLFLFYSKEKCVFFCRTVFRHCWLLRVKTENQTSAVVRSVIPLISEGRKAWWNSLKGVDVTKLYLCWIQKEEASCEIRKSLKRN